MHAHSLHAAPASEAHLGRRRARRAARRAIVGRGNPLHGRRLGVAVPARLVVQRRVVVLDLPRLEAADDVVDEGVRHLVVNGLEIVARVAGRGVHVHRLDGALNARDVGCVRHGCVGGGGGGVGDGGGRALVERAVGHHLGSVDQAANGWS
jgi:hypothetical protein